MRGRSKALMFTNLIGNNEVKAVLTRLISAGRVPHSLLFTGDEGVGKKQFALEAARSLVCRNPVRGEACGTCASCARVGKFSFPKPNDNKEEFEKVISSEHPDVGMVIARGKNILVEAVRDLERQANFLPFEANARVFIVDEAEKMNDAASNALLKTLEEPPPSTYIFLVTSRAGSLLATIRSRCQLLRFSPIPMTEIEDYLVEEKGAEADDAALVARLSRGSIARAIATDLTEFRPRRDVMLGVLQSILQDDDRRALLRVGEKLNEAANKDDYEDNLDILQSLIRDAWIVRLGESKEILVNADLADELRNLAQKAKPSRLADWLREIETMREGLAVNINRKIATDALFMEMAEA